MMRSENKNIVLLLLVVFFVTLTVAGCNAPVSLEGLDMPPLLANSVDAALFEKPGQGGQGLRRSPDNPAVVVRFTKKGFGVASADTSSPAVPPPLAQTRTAYVVFRSVYVPIVDSFDSRTDISLAECLSGKIPLVSLAALPEGKLVLSVNGINVDAAGYPLVAEWTATVEKTRSGISANNAFKKACKGLSLMESSLPSAPDIVWVASAGDIMLERGAGSILETNGPKDSLGGAYPILTGADFAVANLEGAISDRGTKSNKSYTFRYKPSMASSLASTGIDALLLANNHAWDWGPEAFADTLKNLAGAGIAGLGAGADFDAAAKPFTMKLSSGELQAWGLASYPDEKNGWSSVLAASGIGQPGILRAADGGAAAIAKGLTAASLDLVYFHGGEEWSTKPDDKTRALYRALVDAGADAVFGSHPHVVQGFEIYKGKPIFWSLGNFLFPGMVGTPGGEEGLLVLCGFVGDRIIYVKPYALSVTGPRVSLAGSTKTFYARTRALAGPQ